VECRECARILERATVRSLVLVDELGRSTASAEGERFAWSVAEALMKRG
jgi:DNA mismatch repair ATPase MutS